MQHSAFKRTLPKSRTSLHGDVLEKLLVLCYNREYWSAKKYLPDLGTFETFKDFMIT